MAEPEKFCPYAPVGSVISVIQRLRNAGLPDIVDIGGVQRVGVSEGNAGRTVAALRFLGLIDENGKRTELFDQLGRAATSDYPEVLGDILRSAYADVFQILDPATATDIQLNDAFRHYNPTKQRGRMITLFVGLCQEAGIMPGGPPKVQARGISDKPCTSKTHPASATPHTPANDASQGGKPDAQSSRFDEGSVGDYSILMALIRKLPANQQWTRQERDKWVAAYTAVLDLHIQVIDEDEYQENNGN